LRIDIHSVEDYFEVREITARLAQEPGQQVMGELDRALLSIRDDEDDINLRKQPADQPYLSKLFLARGRDNSGRIRFYGPPESLTEATQAFEELYSTFRDHLMDGRHKSLVIFAFPA